MDDKTRSIIIRAYGKVLGARSYSCGKERDLPFPKKLIRQALAEEILVGKHDQDFRNNLEAGFVELETFIPGAELEQVKAWEGTFQKEQELIKKARNPNDVVEQVPHLSGKISFPQHIQLDISKRMKMRLEQIQAMKDLSLIWKE
jgi:hypothetical protein